MEPNTCGNPKCSDKEAKGAKYLMKVSEEDKKGHWVCGKCFDKLEKKEFNK